MQKLNLIFQHVSTAAQDDEIFVIANMHFGRVSGKNLLERMWK